MIQGGGMTSDMRQKKTRAPIRNEADNGEKNLRGTLAMARRITSYNVCYTKLLRISIRCRLVMTLSAATVAASRLSFRNSVTSTTAAKFSEPPM